MFLVSIIFFISLFVIYFKLQKEEKTKPNKPKPCKIIGGKKNKKRIPTKHYTDCIKKSTHCKFRKSKRSSMGPFCDIV